MKFENPIMTISMFEVENVLTQASGQQTQSADDAVTEFINNNTPSANGIKITF